jgi:hypothetical protein
MSATYNPVSKEKEEGNRLGYYYNEDNLPFTKVDYLNIKNPKIIDTLGHMWNNIHEKKYYDISDRLDKIKDRLSDNIYSSIDDEYNSKSNFDDIIYRIVHLYNTT